MLLAEPLDSIIVPVLRASCGAPGGGAAVGAGAGW